MTIAASTQLICFLVLSAVIVLGALGVVLLSNIVYSASVSYTHLTLPTKA